MGGGTLINYERFRAEYVLLAGMTSYQRANYRAEQQRAARMQALDDWWRRVPAETWRQGDNHVVARRTEEAAIAMIRAQADVGAKVIALKGALDSGRIIETWLTA